MRSGIIVKPSDLNFDPQRMRAGSPPNGRIGCSSTHCQDWRLQASAAPEVAADNAGAEQYEIGIVPTM